VSPPDLRKPISITMVAACDESVKAMWPNRGQLCTACAGLLPGEHSLESPEMEWGTLGTLRSSAESCSLCAAILSGRQTWLERGRKKKVYSDGTTSDTCPLRLKVTPSQSHESGVSSNKLVISLVMGHFSIVRFISILACQSDGV
jgi:hypothetical protein